MITVSTTSEKYSVPDLCFYTCYGATYLVTPDLIIAASGTGLYNIPKDSTGYIDTIKKLCAYGKVASLEDFEKAHLAYIDNVSKKLTFIKEVIAAEEIAKL